MKNKILILFTVLSLGMMSCDLGNDPDIGGTATQALAGEFFTQLYSAPGGSLFVDYNQWTISNTAANTADKVRITDEGHVWDFSGVFDANVTNRTFSGTSVANSFYSGAPTGEPDATPFLPIGSLDYTSSASPQFMTITDGAIFVGAAHVPSGTVADSIAMFATGIYSAQQFRVIEYGFDTVSTDPLRIDTFNVFQFVKDTLLADGPYFITGFRRTGFLEDEH